MDEHLSKITEQLKKTKHITDDTLYEMKKIKAVSLLTSKRLDLIAKLKYLECLDKNYNYSFPRQLYEAHLQAFNGDNPCSEAGDDAKNNIDDYISTFKDLYKSFSDKGFCKDISLIPIGKDNVILDGAHRTAIAIYQNLTVDGLFFKDIEENYNYQFFEKNLLASNYLDYMVLEYCKRKQNTFVFCIWPKASNHLRKEAFNILYQKTTVVYEKDIPLTYNGFRNFMIQIYKDCTNWIGNCENHYKGVSSQLDNCYTTGKPLKIFVVEVSNKEEIVQIKKEMRAIFKVNKFSVHSTDNNLETVAMLNILLNANSVYLLNYGNPDKYVKLNQQIEIINKKIEENNLDRDSFVIDSGAVMALFGLRDISDIDYLSLTDISCIDSKTVENHHQALKFYQKNLEDIILNPNNYLVYQGLKFITLDVAKIMKRTRNLKKDLLDIDLIDKFQKSNGHSKKLIMAKCKFILHHQYRKIRLKLINLLKKMHLYDFLYKLLK